MKRIFISIGVVVLFYIMYDFFTNRYYFYSPNKKQCVSVITKNGYRYIIDGKYYFIPDTNYVKIDTKHIDPKIECLHICWEKKPISWEIVVDDALVIETRLDSTKYKFREKLPLNKRGIPTEKRFRKKNCAVFVFWLGRNSPKSETIVSRY